MSPLVSLSSFGELEGDVVRERHESVWNDAKLVLLITVRLFVSTRRRGNFWYVRSSGTQLRFFFQVRVS